MANPEISQIKLPSGTTYDIKDATARNLIEGINNWSYVVATKATNTPKDVVWNNSGTSITGTLVASSTTMYKIYLVPSTNGTKDIYDEYITVNPSGSTYQWEMFGNTDVHMSDLGSFAYANLGTVSIKPSGTNTSSSVSFASHTYETVLKSDVTATVPKPSATTKYFTAAADGGAVSITSSDYAITSLGTPSQEQFIKSYPGVTSKLITTEICGVGSSTTTASKATAGTAVSIAKVGTSTNVANGTLGSETATRGDNTLMWGASVDGETLSFTFKPLSTTSITPAASNGTITPYTFQDVAVPIKNENATILATGSLSSTGSGSSVMTGLGTPTKASGITGYPNFGSAIFAQAVEMTAQPSITLTSSTATSTGAIKYVEKISNSGTNAVTFTTTDHTVNAITALGAGTAAAQQFTGTTNSFDVSPKNS